MESSSPESGEPRAPQPAGETYRDHVIVVLADLRAPGQWHCSGLVVSCYEDGARWPFDLAGPYPDRKAAYTDAVARARRRIDCWFAEVGL